MSESKALTELRRAVIDCNRCFEPTGGHCKHHEDVLGGFGAHRPIVVVGINPQDNGSKLYEAVQKLVGDRSLPLGERLAGSDRFLDVFASTEVNPSLGMVHPRLNDFTRDDHRGLSKWLVSFAAKHRLAAIAGDTERAHRLVAEQFRFIELYKHATKDHATLKKLPNNRLIRKNCKGFITDQLEELDPVGIVLAGLDVLTLTLPLLMKPEQYRALINEQPGVPTSLKAKWAHGRTTEYERRDGRRVPILMTLANSGHTLGDWATSPGTENVHATIARWLETTSTNRTA